MITTRGCLSSYRKGEDPSAKINAWLKDNPDARLLDVKFIPVYSGDYAAYPVDQRVQISGFVH